MRKLIYKTIFSMVLVLFAFVSVFKIPLIKVNATQEDEVITPQNVYNEFTWLISGVYYHESTNDYMLILHEEIRDEYLITIKVHDEFDYFYNFTTDLQNYVAFGDIVKFDADLNDYFSWWWGEYYDDISLFGDLYVYIIVGGNFFPPLYPPQLPLIYVEIYDTNFVVPIRSKQWVRDVVNLIDYTYHDAYDDGYDEGKEYGIEFGREHWYNVGYEVGYNKGVNDQIVAERDFAYLLRSAFVAIGSFLGINLLPGISIGAIIAVPIVFGIIAFILGRKKD